MSLFHRDFYAANVWQRQQRRRLKTERGKRGRSLRKRGLPYRVALPTCAFLVLYIVPDSATIAPLLRTTARSGTAHACRGRRPASLARKEPLAPTRVTCPGSTSPGDPEGPVASTGVHRDSDIDLRRLCLTRRDGCWACRGPECVACDATFLLCCLQTTYVFERP